MGAEEGVGFQPTRHALLRRGPDLSVNSSTKAAEDSTSSAAFFLPSWYAIYGGAWPFVNLQHRSRMGIRPRIATLPLYYVCTARERNTKLHSKRSYTMFRCCARPSVMFGVERQHETTCRGANVAAMLDRPPTRCCACHCSTTLPAGFACGVDAAR